MIPFSPYPPSLCPFNTSLSLPYAINPPSLFPLANHLAHGVKGAQDDVVQVAVAQQQGRVAAEGVLEGRPHPVHLVAAQLCDG